MYGFILDLDGTVYAGSQPIAHAAAFVEQLRARSLPYLFATNNSSRTPEQVAEHLRRVAGIPAAASEVLTTAQAAARYVASQCGGQARVFAIGEAGLLAALREAGLTIMGNAEAEDTALKATLSGTVAGTHGGAPEFAEFVVQGIDRRFDYDKLTAAVRHILAGAVYVQTNPDHLLPTDGGFAPGAGSIGAAIAAASGAAPVVIGKPSPIMMRFAAERLGLPADRLWAVGDNLRTDIAGGQAAGFHTALVLTGLVTRDNLDAQLAQTGVVPELVCSDLLELADRLGLS